MGYEVREPQNQDVKNTPADEVIEDNTEDPLTAYIHRRLYQYNKNWLAIICGETGSGKSYSALKIAETADPTFSAERVVFSAPQFIRLLGKKLKKGNIVVFDEAGVGMPAREWYSISNKTLGYILQTFRHQNLGVIFTTPDFSFMDVQARKLFHSYFETTTIDRNKKCVVLKWMNLSVSPRYGKIYFIYPTVQQNYTRVKLKKINVYYPSPELVRSYELKKSAFSRNLRKEIEQKLEI
jgi:hypothetical protein